MVRGRLAALVGLGALAACATGRPRGPAGGALDGSDVTLYRDGALVQQRVEVDVPAGGVAAVRVRIPAGLGAEDVVAFPREGVGLVELREAGAVQTEVMPPPPPAGAGTALELEYSEESLARLQAESVLEARHSRPIELELVVRAPPGRAALRLGYVTDRLTWDVAYTLTANAAHDRAVLRGAVAIRNRMGIALPAARVRLVDSPLSDAKQYAADELASRFTRQGPGERPPAPRELGRLDLADGETRIELLPDQAPRPMRSVLLYDPIGTEIDHSGGGQPPATDADLGVRPPPGRRVDESLEFDRDPATAGLPAGPVRLLERRADGALAFLGEARLFEASARVAVSDTIAIGTADDVTGERERRELTVDTDRKRVVEEFVITIANARPRPVEVVLREHLYRGPNWALTYTSVPVGLEHKEGSQQIAPRITVPARSKARFMYAVVYSWPRPPEDLQER